MRNLPKGWVLKSLGDVTECLDSQRIPITKNQREKGEVPYYGANGIQGYIKGHIFDEELLLVAEDGGSWGPNEKCSYIISGKSWVNNHAHVLRMKNTILIKFLEAFLNLTDLRRYISGTTRGKLNQKQLNQIEIPLPPLPVQKQIVAVLEQAEKLKERREKANEETERLVQGIFVRQFGNPIINDMNLPIERLGNISKIDMGGTPNTKVQTYWENGTVPWMKSGDIKDDYIKDIPNKITEGGLKNSNAKVYNKGDVVIALNGQGKTRATTGILAVNTSSNQSVASISPDKNKLSSEYLHYNLKLRYKQLRDITGDSQRSGLNLSILRSLDIPFPPISLQNQFSEAVKKIEALKERQKKSTQDINQLFDALMQKAFSGGLIAN